MSILPYHEVNLDMLSRQQHLRCQQISDVFHFQIIFACAVLYYVNTLYFLAAVFQTTVIFLICETIVMIFKHTVMHRHQLTKNSVSILYKNIYLLYKYILLSLSLSLSLSLWGKTTLKNFKTSQTSSSRVVVSLSLLLKEEGWQHQRE